MRAMELQLCLNKGQEVVKTIAKTGCNCIGFGEME
jgi:nicotinate-nucleotide--dimethylbenzimidazole phosphoribosyltransferase